MSFRIPLGATLRFCREVLYLHADWQMPAVRGGPLECSQRPYDYATQRPDGFSTILRWIMKPIQSFQCFAAGQLGPVDEDTTAFSTSAFSGDDENCMSEGSIDASEDPGLEQILQASQKWSRIIRRPRKRHGHVIVDLCTAAGSNISMQLSSSRDGGVPSAQMQEDKLRASQLPKLKIWRSQFCCAGPTQNPQASGALLQQAVSKGERKKYLGPSGYRLAKKLTWGDLWPASFERFAHKIKERDQDISHDD